MLQSHCAVQNQKRVSCQYCGYVLTDCHVYIWLITLQSGILLRTSVLINFAYINFIMKSTTSISAHPPNINSLIWNLPNKTESLK